MAGSGEGASILHCSFCGKSQEDVRKLVAGPAVYICDECIGLCDYILELERAKDGSLPFPVAHHVPPRIEPVSLDDVSDRTREVLELTKGLNGDGVLNVFGVLAHHSGALRHAIALGGVFMFRSNIGDRAREIVIIRVAPNTRCEYEYAQHLVIAQRCGLTAAECEALLTSEIGPTFSAFEHEIVEAVDVLCRDEVLGDDLWTHLAEEWGDRQLLELLVLTGYYRMLAGYLVNAGVQIDAGLSGFPENAAGTASVGELG